MLPFRPWATTVAAAVLAAGAGLAQTTLRASVASSAAEGDGASRSASISGDGAFVVFWSEASNLVPGDTNGCLDVFVHEPVSGTTACVSVDSQGLQGDRPSYRPAISADGRFVAFASDATNLVAGDANRCADVFVHDRATGTTTRASVGLLGAEADAASLRPAISADGRWVAFASDASNLVVGDANGVRDVFVHDRADATTTRASVASDGGAGDGASSGPSLSADGRCVAFTSLASNLAAGDVNGLWDAFVHDRASGLTTRVSDAAGAGPGDGDSFAFSITADGREVAYWSRATNLVRGDLNASADAFVHDRATGATSRVSLGPSGTEADGASFDPSISADGRFVAYVSAATNLVGADQNACDDVFHLDRLTGTATRVSVDSAGVPGDGASFEPSLSADGRLVVFWSEASNLAPADTNGVPDVFVHERGPTSSFVAHCSGRAGLCPCGNAGASGRGCDNSAATGGALLSASGVASLAADTVELACSGTLDAALAIVLQGDRALAPVVFGDGLRCVGGALNRLYVLHASGGALTVPGVGDATLSARSASLGDPLPLGATRHVQVYYRDPEVAFCAAPPGATFNVSNAIAIAWGVW